MKIGKIQNKTSQHWHLTAVLVQAFLGTYALSGNDWEMASIFIFLGLAAAFWTVQNKILHTLQGDKRIFPAAAFFSICTVTGRSYELSGNFAPLIESPAQVCKTFVSLLGFFCLYRGALLLIFGLLDNQRIFRRDCRNKAEKLLFEQHPFLAPLAIIFVSSLPVLISFFPGTLEADAYVQLSHMRSGNWDAHYPVAASLLMDGIIRLGQRLFGHDNLAFFLYTGTQYALQWLVFSYTLSVLKRMKTPIVIRWGTLAYFSFFSVFRMYGYTMVKDTLFYIAFLLSAAVTADIITEENLNGGKVRKRLLIIALFFANLLMVFSRNNGLHLILFSVVMGFLLCRKYQRVYLTMLAGAILGTLINGGLGQIYGVSQGSVREMLSVPLQQTARYLTEHYDEITTEERMVLEEIFETDLETVAQSYQPEIADPVKAYMVYYPDAKALTAYLQVWWQQFLKHPDTYVQAFINHTYGYFYPDRECFWEGIGVYDIGESWPWDKMNFAPCFVLDNRQIREQIRQTHLWMSRLPLFGGLYSCGMHNFLLIGMFVWLLIRNRKKDLFFLVPCIGCVLICLISPVNALIRYMLPVMAAFPLNLAWCFRYTFPKASPLP
ncbi:MAG: DUF6020 family protein [Clostridium sp.]|nr:DUF6020 family protein [Clostridium sp.]